MNQAITSRRFIIAGGGTGGHIFPAVAIARALQRRLPGVELLFVGAKGKMEMEKVPAEGFNVIGLDIAGFQRKAIWKNVSLPFKLLSSFIQAYKILKSFKPEVAIGVGGYASFPVLFVAQRMGIPTLIQEQNSFAGKSNQILGRRAKCVCVAFENMDRFFPAQVIKLTGNPVRPGIGQNIWNRNELCQHFKLQADKKTVFVFGGSLGARSINEAIRNNLDYFQKHELQLIWQTGQLFIEEARQAARGKEAFIQVMPFIREMDMAYALADYIIARAGASSIAELCVVGKPVIFVPYPYASEDHQTHNALALVQRNAAMMVKDQEATHQLIPKLDALIQDKTLDKLLADNIQIMQIRHADEAIVDEILQLAS